MLNLNPTPGDWLLHDIQYVAQQVLGEHAGLLSFEERALGCEILSLSGAEGRLWARLLGRVGEVFLVSGLDYADIDDPAVATQRLVDLGLARLVENPRLRLSCFHLDRLRGTCRDLGVSSTGPKSALVQRLVDEPVLREERVVELRHKKLFKRFELLCFGRAGRDRSERLLQRIGTLCLPEYSLTSAHPLFSSRAALLEFEDLQDTGETTSTEFLLEAWMRLVPRPAWLSQVDARCLVERELAIRARGLERAGQSEDAAAIYARLIAMEPRNPGPLVRRLSLCLERSGQSAQGAMVCAAWRTRVAADCRLDLERTGRRLARKAARSWRPSSPLRTPRRRVLMVSASQEEDGKRRWAGGESIERAVVKQVRPREAIFGENSLWKTLFSLFFYDLYWLPIPGMLPVKGLAGPLDLGTPHFVGARSVPIQERLAEMCEGDPREILDRGLSHRGERVAWLNWDLASDETLRRVTKAVGGRILRQIFCRMLWRGKEACRGLPDLLVMDGTPTRLDGAFPGSLGEEAVFVEVKGPGDTLSGAQRIWMDYLLDAGARVEVWDVRPEEDRGQCQS